MTNEFERRRGCAGAKGWTNVVVKQFGEGGMEYNWKSHRAMGRGAVAAGMATSAKV